MCKSRNASATSLQCTSYNYDHWRSCVTGGNLCTNADSSYWPAWCRKTIATQLGCTGTGYDTELVGACLTDRQGDGMSQYAGF